MDIKEEAVSRCDEGDVSIIPTEPTPGEPAAEVRQEPPDLSPAGLRKLRGQYFTIRHIPLTDCGHKLDVLNEPRDRNCQNCFWQWMNFHPQLVSTVDEAWREHGKEFVIRLRGKHFANQFGRYMATVAHFKEQEKANVDQQGESDSSGQEGQGGTDFAFGHNVEGGQTESCPVSGEVA